MDALRSAKEGNRSIHEKDGVMDNLSDSEIIKAHPDIRKKMKEVEQMARDFIEARENGTLEIIEDESHEQL